MDPENPNNPRPGEQPPEPNSNPDPTENEDAEESASGRARTGKVARLEKKLRDQVSQMLLDGFSYRKIIESLGDAGKHLTEKNIGNWRTKGGFQDWLDDRDRKDVLRLTRDSALDIIHEKSGVPIQEAGRTIAAGQLFELMLSFNPNSLAEALKQKPELYFRIIDCLARLCESEAVCSHRRTQESLLQTKGTSSQPGAAKNVPSEQTLKDIARHSKLI